MQMRWQLFIVFGLIILVTLGTVATVSRYTAEREVQSFLRHGGQVSLENLSASLESYYSKQGSWSGVEIKLGAGAGRGRGQRSGANADQGDITLADAEGVILISGNNDEIGNTLTDRETKNAIELKVSDEVVGYLVPENAIPQYPQNFDSQLMERINRATLLSALISGAAAVLLSVIFAGIILKPVRELTSAVRKMSEGDLSQRVKFSGNSELAVLGKTFNHMAQSLQDSVTRRKAMTADIAHELRNPLAVQRAQLEALQDGIYPLSQEKLEGIYAQNKALSYLVEDLRLLALADAGELSLTKTEFDLRQLCLDTLSSFQPQSSIKGILLEANLREGPYYIKADRERVQQIIYNLMQNALRYTPDGGKIKLAISKEEKKVSLRVYNSGPQMSDETLSQLFERFYRGDRGRDRAGGGTGLGLSIAKKLTEAHFGTLTGENHPEGGVVFTLTFPLQKST